MIGLTIAYASMGPHAHLMMVSVAGAAVKLRREATLTPTPKVVALGPGPRLTEVG